MYRFTNEPQPGYLKYREKWGEYDFEGVPPCLMICMEPLECVYELGQLLGDCVSRGKKPTAREVITALYYDDGFYCFDTIKEKRYKDFIRRTNKLSDESVI